MAVICPIYGSNKGGVRPWRPGDPPDRAGRPTKPVSDALTNALAAHSRAARRPHIDSRRPTYGAGSKRTAARPERPIKSRRNDKNTSHAVR